MFVATLSGAHEVPPNLSRGGGGAILTLNLTTRGWGLMGAISNLVNGATAAHIHGPAPAGPLTGNAVFTEEQLDWLAAGLLNVNIHTADHPGGEIRGQLFAVPEPGAYARSPAWASAR